GGGRRRGKRRRMRPAPAAPRPHGRADMSLAVDTPRRWRKPPFIARAWLRWTLGLGAALYLALALGTTEVNWGRVWEGLPRGARFVAAFFPPDFASRWS